MKIETSYLNRGSGLTRHFVTNLAGWSGYYI